MLTEECIFNDLSKQRPRKVFDLGTLEFLRNLSKSIMNDKNVRSYPDLASFAFFCRPANIKKLSDAHMSSMSTHFGRGVTLHFAPSNVPLNFAYSMFAGLITGNICLIRLSSKEFPQATLLIKIINKLLRHQDYQFLKGRLCLFRYEKNRRLTDYLSSLADVRIIWGGDSSIAEIRKSELPSYGIDITFADRNSICIIDAQNYLKKFDKKREALFFFNDTLFFDQNACTSPRVVYWIGKKENIDKARRIFWKELDNIVKDKNYFPPANVTVDKLKAQYGAAIEYGSKSNKTDSIVKTSLLERVPSSYTHLLVPGGFFLEVISESIDLLDIKFSRKQQTITYIGISSDTIFDRLDVGTSYGINRIVPSGTASDFSLNWDGYNLLYCMSRCVSLQ